MNNTLLLILLLIVTSIASLLAMSEDGKLSEWTTTEKCPKCASKQLHQSKKSRTYTKPKLFGKKPDGFDKLEAHDTCTDLTPCPIIITPSMIKFKSDEQKITFADLKLLKELFSNAQISKKQLEEYEKTFENEDVKEMLMFMNVNIVPSVPAFNALVPQPSFKFNTIKEGDYTFNIRYYTVNMNSELYMSVDNGIWEKFIVENTDDSNFKTVNIVSKRLSKGDHFVNFSFGLIENKTLISKKSTDEYNPGTIKPASVLNKFIIEMK